MFDVAMIRFGLSGTLILFFGIADHFARRRAHGAPAPASPRWTRVLWLISMTAYYALIGPYGGALFGGIGNYAGIALVALAITLRAISPASRTALVGRCLFYVGLPIAVGVPWGLLALSLPACASTIYVARRRMAGTMESGALAPAPAELERS